MRLPWVIVRREDLEYLAHLEHEHELLVRQVVDRQDEYKRLEEAITETARQRYQGKLDMVAQASHAEGYSLGYGKGLKHAPVDMDEAINRVIVQLRSPLCPINATSEQLRHFLSMTLFGKGEEG